jgi:hypothetical protein
MGDGERRGGGARVSARAPAAVLWLVAAAISAFTIRRHLEPFDEGLLLQAAARIADGQWPYADFGWPYGPGQPGVVALASEAFGRSVLWWRLVRVAADAALALAVWALVRPAAGDRWALAAWLAAAVTVAQPTSANPFPVALAFAVCAVLAGARGRPVAAGALAALTAFWRPDLGVVAALAVLAALLARGRSSAVGRSRPVSGDASGRRGPRRPAAMAALAALVAVAVLYAPFAAVAGPGRLADELVGVAAGDGTFWRLPFPLSYGGPLRGWPPSALAEDLKDVLGFYLALAAAIAAVLAAVALMRRRGERLAPPPEAAGLLVLAAGCALYLASRPDELHVQPLVAVLCALVPLAATHAGPGRALRVALACALALFVLAGAANRLSALLLPPVLEPVRLAGVPGIRVPAAEARALPALAARVQQLVPPGEPIYVAPRRSDLVTLTNPLVHFLVRRPNVLDRDVSLQAKPEEQSRIVAALRRTPPRVVVRWTDPVSARPEPNSRGRPSGSRALDEHLAAAYRLEARHGAYDLLVRR